MILPELVISTHPALRISNSQHLPNLAVLLYQEIWRDRTLWQHVLDELCTCLTRAHIRSDVARMITCWHVRIETHNVTSINGQHTWHANLLDLGYDIGMNFFVLSKFDVFYSWLLVSRTRTTLYIEVILSKKCDSTLVYEHSNSNGLRQQGTRPILVILPKHSQNTNICLETSKCDKCDKCHKYY